MKNIQGINDTIAAAGASTSVVTAIAAKATELQPIISATSGLIAIITGLFAILYYVKKLNRIDGKDSKQPN
jgi:hypothetical protein